jgi:hypothetical protein
MNRSIILLLAGFTVLVVFARCNQVSNRPHAVLYAARPHDPTPREIVEKRLRQSSVTTPSVTTKDALLVDPDSETGGCWGPRHQWMCANRPHAPVEMHATYNIASPSLLVSNWYVDGHQSQTCASDGNSCTSATCGTPGVGPCLTAQQIEMRLGTNAPAFPQVTTIHLLSDMLPTDSITIVPTPVQAGGFKVIGSYAVTYATVTLGSYTPLVHCTSFGSTGCAVAGTKGQITVPGFNWSTGCGGTSCVGADVHESGGGRSIQFEIDADLGSGTASITTPWKLPWSFGVPYGTPTAGDTLVVGRPANVIIPVTGVHSFGTSFVTTWLEELTLTGPLTNFLGYGSNFELFSSIGAAPTSYVWNNFSGDHNFYSCFFGTGTSPIWAGPGHFFGGEFNGDGTYFYGGTIMDGDVILNGRTHQDGEITIGAAYFAQTPDLDSGFPTWILTTEQFGPALWGPGGLQLAVNSQFWVAEGVNAVSSLLLTGGLGLFNNSVGGGWQWDDSTATYINTIIPVTPLAIDNIPAGNVCIGQPPTASGFCKQG